MGARGKSRLKAPTKELVAPPSSQSLPVFSSCSFLAQPNLFNLAQRCPIDDTLTTNRKTLLTCSLLCFHSRFPPAIHQRDSCSGTLGDWSSSSGELLSIPPPESRLPTMSHVKSAAVLLSPANVGNLFDSVDAFLFDCDGVIWKGDKLIDGVPETLEMLRSKGKQLIFVTNNSTKSRRQYAKKFHSLGIPVSEDEIFSSSFAAAMYLKVNSFPKEKKVYVIGQEGILEELQLAGYTGLGGPEDAMKTVDWKQNWLLEHDEKVGAVVVGLDPNINYYKLQYATLCIRENPGCIFIATNRDAVGHMTDLQEWPGAGCMVAAVCGSTEKEPIVVGKPSTFMMEFLREKFDISCSKMCMVGDRLDTDILFGHNAGCKTLLVFSGVTTQCNLEDPSNSIRPDYYTNKVSDLLELLGQ